MNDTRTTTDILLETLNFTLHDEGTYVNMTVPIQEHILPEYIFWYVTVLNFLIFIVGISGNVLVLCVIWLQKTMRTHMNFLLCSLAAADLFVLLICLPIGLAEFYGKDRWYLGEPMCEYICYIIEMFGFIRELQVGVMRKR